MSKWAEVKKIMVLCVISNLTIQGRCLRWDLLSLLTTLVIVYHFWQIEDDVTKSKSHIILIYYFEATDYVILQTLFS